MWETLLRGCGFGAALTLVVGVLSPSSALANGGVSVGDPTSGRVAVVSPNPNLANRGLTAKALPSLANIVLSRTANGSVVIYYDSVFNIGGVLSSAPSAALVDPELHVVGSNGGIVFHNSSEDSQDWSGWMPIGEGSDPVVVGYLGQVHVVYRAVNGNVIDTWLDGSTWRTANLGGVIVGTPSVIVYGNQFQVFGANGGIVFQKWFNPDTFSWFGWTAISTGSDPSAALFSQQLHVLSRANAGNVVDHWYGSGVWYTVDLGGIIAGMPGAAGIPDVFRVVGANNGVVYQRTYSAGLWSPWVSFSTGSVPVAFGSSFGESPLYSVYSRNSNGTIQQSGYLDNLAFQRTFPQ